MIQGKDIICISSIDWDFVWQGHQEIMSTFSKNGNRVLFIENTGIRMPRLGDIGRIRRRLNNWRKGLKGIRQESRNLFICSPIIAPFPYSRIAKFINRFLLVNSIRAWMRAIGFNNPIIWTFLPTSLSVDIIDNITHDLVVYYCIAEFTELADSSKKVDRAEKELLKRCDVVFAQGQKIKERCKRYAGNVYIFPFGVKSDIFLKVSQANVPGDIKNIKRPILGYVGGVHKHIDFNLLKCLAEEVPESSIVLVGPVQTKEAESLKSFKNIYFLGHKDHAELPAYIDSFDLCLIPYLISEYTATVYPTKLNEYLMRGRRVLSTPLPEVKKFAETFGDVVSISEGEGDFVKKAKELLGALHDASLARRSIDVARRNSWEARIEEMSALIEDALKKKDLETSIRWRDNFIRLMKKNRRGIAAFVSVVAILYAVLFYTPLIWFIGKPLKISDPPGKADAIVALGGGVGETGRAGQGYEERVKYASELYKAGYAKKIIFSSGFVYAFDEPDVMKALAVSLGVPSSDVILEKKAKSTYENIKFSLAIADEKNMKRIIFVSSPYHMLRLKMTAQRLAPDPSRFIFAPIPHSLFYGGEKHVMLKHIKAILGEYAKLIYYKFKGYL